MHVYLYGDVFSLWGHGKLSMILISLMQLTCTYYTFALANTTDLVELTKLYGYRTYYLILVGISSAPVALITFFAFYSYQ